MPDADAVVTFKSPVVVETSTPRTGDAENVQSVCLADDQTAAVAELFVSVRFVTFVSSVTDVALVTRLVAATSAHRPARGDRALAVKVAVVAAVNVPPVKAIAADLTSSAPVTVSEPGTFTASPLPPVVTARLPTPWPPTPS